MNDSDKLRDRLQAALENVLSALVLAGVDLRDETPADAIDAALSTDPSVQTARQALDVAVRALDGAEAGDGHRQAVLAVEEAVNALVARAADAGYRVGVRVGRGLRG